MVNEFVSNEEQQPRSIYVPSELWIDDQPWDIEENDDDIPIENSINRQDWDDEEIAQSKRK